MPERETPGPRHNPPGPTGPRLEAVERLRRELEALESRKSRRAVSTRAASPRTRTRTTAPDADSLHSGYGPAIGSWVESHPATGSTGYGTSSADYGTDGSGPTSGEPGNPAPRGRFYADPEDTPGDIHADDDPWADPESAVTQRRSPLGRRRSPGQRQEEESAAPGDGGEAGKSRRISSRRTDAPRAAEAESAPHDPNGDGSPSPHLPDNEPGQEDSRDAGNGWGSARGSRRGRGGASRSGYGATEDDETRGARRRGGRGRARPDGTASETGESGLPGGGTDAQAKEVCLRLLTDRARSRAELADKLAAKGFSTAVADRALDRLTEVGLIDDQAFAEQWVHSRHTFSGKGKKALAQELRRKGVAQEHAEEALSRISAEDEDERAADLVQRKLRSLPRDLDREKAIRRLVGMLARRGYNQSTAFTVVKNALADRDLGDLDEPGSL